MTDITTKTCDVAVIGGGPSGLSAAITLKQAGVKSVVVLDREAVAGGIPRHCGHPPFGLAEFKRILTGPEYAKRIVKKAQQEGVEIALKTTVVLLEKQGRLTLVSPDGTSQLLAKRVLLATGTRETPRSARFVSGNRPIGICNTGALQSMVYLKNMVPFRSPLVVGTEIVSFSALMTCKKAGIKPVAMIEQNTRPSVQWPVYYAASFFGVPLRRKTRIVEIIGGNRVESVIIAGGNGKEEKIPCDGVLFTGLFTPESSLARMSHLALDPDTGCPLVDNNGRCSDPVYFAAGNVIFQPVKVAGKCWQSGIRIARAIVDDLSG
ncbi:MAG: pyridine nucleotide-disulfide oxidoreductase [Desulfobulbus sp.]|nr:MAG: pyridine nucleotide-disulfide oxidoreductase [Desulfobulbus sp.]